MHSGESNLHAIAVMSLTSDLSINVSKLKPDAVPPSDKQLNDLLIDLTEKGPHFYDVGFATQFTPATRWTLTIIGGRCSEIQTNERKRRNDTT